MSLISNKIILSEKNNYLEKILRFSSGLGDGRGLAMHSHEMLGTAAACPSNPRSGEVEAGGPLGMVGHPCSS